MNFVIGKEYKTRNGSTVVFRRIDNGGSYVFKVLVGGRSFGGFPEDDEFWAGGRIGSTYNTRFDGYYIGDVRAMDIVFDSFILNEQYLTYDDSIVEYIGNYSFKLIKAKKVSKKAPWATVPEGAIYLVDVDGSYLGALRGLDIKNKIEKPENDTQI